MGGSGPVDLNMYQHVTYVWIHISTTGPEPAIDGLVRARKRVSNQVLTCLQVLGTGTGYRPKYYKPEKVLETGYRPAYYNPDHKSSTGWEQVQILSSSTPYRGAVINGL
jgi:hypothetical protein